MQSQSQALHRLVDPQYQTRLAALGDEFALAKSNGLVSDDLAQVAQVPTGGWVAKMLIDPDIQTSGRLDSATRRIEAANLSHPQVDEPFDDPEDLAWKMGGRDWVPPMANEPITITKGEHHADPIQYRP